MEYEDLLLKDPDQDTLTIDSDLFDHDSPATHSDAPPIDSDDTFIEPIMNPYMRLVKYCAELLEASNAGRYQEADEIYFNAVAFAEENQLDSPMRNSALLRIERVYKITQKEAANYKQSAVHENIHHAFEHSRVEKYDPAESSVDNLVILPQDEEDYQKSENERMAEILSFSDYQRG